MVGWNRAAVARASARLDDGLEDAGRLLEALSNELVPDLTGSLQASSQVTVGRDEVAVSYSDPAAVPQHERLDYAHDDGQAKYLEQALTRNERRLVEVVADGVRLALL